MAGSAVSLRVVLNVLVIAAAVWLDGVPWAVEAQQFSLTHRYAHLEGSPARSGGEGVSQEYLETLVAHDRRRLVAVLNFPLNGTFLTTTLYHTQISLGTPPRQYSVFVDTGSDITWVKCAPCLGCPLQSDTPGFTFTQYDPSLSSTEKVLPCASPDCEIAQNRLAPGGVCGNPVSPQACSYALGYVSGETSRGYFLNDVMTFNLVVNGTTTVTTADVYFGCSHNVTGSFNSARFLDGLMGFGLGAITIPNQIATQKKTSRSFAHCLQGNDPEGSVIVMGNITEPGIVYTPIIPDRGSYYISMQNIAVNGANITTPASFDTRPDGRGGVILDTGSNFGLLVQPAYDEFVASVVNYTGFPIMPVRNVFWADQETPCFLYNGSLLDEKFPKVKLLFDGGADMNLRPLNYLVRIRFITGETAYCIAWAPSSLITIFGNIVLQDQLVVYDMDKRRVGWKPFNCSESFSVETGLITTAPPVQAPSSSIRGSSSGAQTRKNMWLLSSCLAVAFLLTTLF